MADVLLNRADKSGQSVATVAAAKGQFLAYAAGTAKYQAYGQEDVGSSDCDDLTLAVGAMKTEETGPRLSTTVMFWVSTVQNGRARTLRKGDFRVADTDFSSNPFGVGRRRRRK